MTLLNVQSEPDDADVDQAIGTEVISDVAADAELATDEYESRVIVTDDDVRDVLVAEATAYETVCVGATGTSTVAQALYGSIPQRIVSESDRTVLMARGDQRAPRTFRQAVIQRLER